MSERTEALMRIVVIIVSGIILSLWKGLIQILVLVHFVMILVTGKRSKELAEFSHIWNCQIYTFLKYATFATNKRPFPFTELAKVDKAEV
ncbi:hypothetical protein CMO88_02750 [Candidatus Woesearchaeota archaeon]|nr:hypothetical protein [Candidatus Woesearchaeota archaeon]|tara:strand:- start:14960 stop:15229 length:270 start_codon:yes stop_codon:yes gene_type:complete